MAPTRPQPVPTSPLLGLATTVQAGQHFQLTPICGLQVLDWLWACWVSLSESSFNCVVLQSQDGRAKDHSLWHQALVWWVGWHGSNALCTGQQILIKTNLVSTKRKKDYIFLLTPLYQPLDLVKTRMQVAKSSGGTKPSTVNTEPHEPITYLSHIPISSLP